MKKTMFITSVIMVIVMAIALTTSSLAWFSAAGSADVTTTALSVTAKAQASAGLQISNDQSVWSANISLDADDAIGSMDPAMPYTYDTDKTPLDALAAYDASTAATFITNKIDQNNKYLNERSTTPVIFSTEFYITNISQGSSAGDIVVGPKIITPSIKFSDATTDYTYNSLDALLYVAVLADNNITVTNQDPAYSAGESVDYRIVKLFASSQATGASVGEYITDSLTTVNFGGAYELFAEGGNALGSGLNNSWASTSITKTDTTTPLAPIYHNNAIGEVKKFKVVAWYDGASLKNSNSGGTLKFELKFSASNYVANP